MTEIQRQRTFTPEAFKIISMWVLGLCGLDPRRAVRGRGWNRPRARRSTGPRRPFAGGVPWLRGRSGPEELSRPVDGRLAGRSVPSAGVAGLVEAQVRLMCNGIVSTALTAATIVAPQKPGQNRCFGRAAIQRVVVSPTRTTSRVRLGYASHTRRSCPVPGRCCPGRTRNVRPRRPLRALRSPGARLPRGRACRTRAR